MTDLRWLDDLDPNGTETADAGEELVQDLYHVIEEDRGSNLDDETRGLGVANRLSDVLPADFTTTVDRELMDDDRVNTATSTLGVDAQGNATLNVKIEPVDDLLEELNLVVPLVKSTSGSAS